jgi:hypothetical protein
MKIAFFSAVLYYSQTPLTFLPVPRLLTLNTMRIIIGAMLVIISWLSELLGVSINPLAYYDAFFSKVFAQNYKPTAPATTTTVNKDNLKKE